MIGELIDLAKSINIEIDIRQNNIQMRKEDYTIMEDFINAGVEGNTLNTFNDIRMNMQVTYVSKKSTAKGDAICKWAIQYKTVNRKIEW